MDVPLPVEKSTDTVANLNVRSGRPEEYACDFAGNTVLSVGEEAPSASGQELKWDRAFRREYLGGTRAPMKPKPLYEPPRRLINWDLRVL